jgi:hypothetical protein
LKIENLDHLGLVAGKGGDRLNSILIIRIL